MRQREDEAARRAERFGSNFIAAKKRLGTLELPAGQFRSVLV